MKHSSRILSGLIYTLLLSLCAANVLAALADPVLLYQEQEPGILKEGQLSPDGRYWVYTIDVKQSGKTVKHVISLSTGANPTWVDLTDESMLNGLSEVGYLWQISPDSKWVVYGMEIADFIYDATTDTYQKPGNILFSVPIDGSRQPVKLSLPQYELPHNNVVYRNFGAKISDDSQWVLFQSSIEGADSSSLGQAYTVPINGSKPAVNIIENLKQRFEIPEHFYPQWHGFLPDSHQIYFSYNWRNDGTEPFMMEPHVSKYWFKRPVDGSGKAQLLFPEQASANTRINIYPYPYLNQKLEGQWLYTISQTPKPAGFFKPHYHKGSSLIQFNPVTGQKTEIPTGLPDDAWFQISKIVGPWVVFFTEDAHYVVNSEHPEQRLKISGKAVPGTSPKLAVLDILPKRQAVAYTTLTLNPGVHNRGVMRLYLQSLLKDDPPILLAKGPWFIGFLQHFGQGPSFQFTDDEQWLIYSNTLNDSLFDSYWVNLDKVGQPELHWPEDHFDWQVTFSTPSANRLVFTQPPTPIIDHTKVPFNGYDPLVLDPNQYFDLHSLDTHIHSVFLPDNCQALLIQADQTLYKTECDRPFTELWWNPDFSGQGLRVQQTGNRIFAVWFTYDETGQATWMTLSGELKNNRLQGTLNKFTGPALGQAWLASKVQSQTVGTATLELGDDRSRAFFSYQLKKTSGSVTLQPFYEGPRNLYDGFWWQADSSGQGVQLYRKGNTLFGTLYLYDEMGKSFWVTFQGEIKPASSSFKAVLNRFSGPQLGAEWRVEAVKGEVIGEINLKLDKPSFIRMNAKINGKPLRLNLVPFKF